MTHAGNFSTVARAELDPGTDSGTQGLIRYTVVATLSGNSWREGKRQETEGMEKRVKCRTSHKSHPSRAKRGGILLIPCVTMAKRATYQHRAANTNQLGARSRQQTQSNTMPALNWTQPFAEDATNRSVKVSPVHTAGRSKPPRTAPPTRNT